MRLHIHNKIDLVSIEGMSSSTCRVFENEEIYIAIGAAGRSNIPIITFEMWGVFLIAGKDVIDVFRTIRNEDHAIIRKFVFDLLQKNLTIDNYVELFDLHHRAGQIEGRNELRKKLTDLMVCELESR